MAEPVPLRMTAAAVTRVIQQRATASDNVIVTNHAGERMWERGFTLDDVLTILRRGRVWELPFKNEHGDWQAEIERRMPGGREAVVITVVPQGPRLIVVTVMWRDK